MGGGAIACRITYFIVFVILTACCYIIPQIYVLPVNAHIQQLDVSTS